MYLSDSEYLSMGGTLTGSAFRRAEKRAEALIDRMTQGRLRNESPVRECVKELVFELIRTGYRAEGTDVRSVSNDGYTVSYGTRQETARSSAGLIRDYLSEETTAEGVPLLYAGVDP